MPAGWDGGGRFTQPRRAQRLGLLPTQPSPDRLYYSALYGGVVAATLVAGIFRSALFFGVCLHASGSIFRTMLQTILRVPVQFFVDNPHGRILNRFAKDLVRGHAPTAWAGAGAADAPARSAAMRARARHAQALADELLPMTFYDFSQCLFIVLGTFVVVGRVTPYVLLSLLPLGAAFWYLRHYFVTSSREVKRLVRGGAARRPRRARCRRR